MNFTYVEFPSTVDLNTLKAYINLDKTILPRIHGKALLPPANSGETNAEVNLNAFKSLRHLVLDAIIDNWNENPIYADIPRREDRNYVLCNLNVNLPLKLLSEHIRDDFFWRKCYQHRWKTTYHSTYNNRQQLLLREQQNKQHSKQHSKQRGKRHKKPATNAKPWISIYMERHLQEFIENVETCDYDRESLLATLDTCAAHINQLELNFLQAPPLPLDAAGGQRNDHIPLDYILSNLPELHTLRLTYCTKTIGTNFYLGCNTLTQNDILLLARGLNCCYELQNFCLHSTKLQTNQLRYLARSLDKGCHKFHTLALKHCAIGDAGLRQFIEACHTESFATLKTLDLTNNNISADGAYALSRNLRRLSLQSLTLRLNPIESDGAAAIFGIVNYLPLKHLDISGCSMCALITKLFLQLVIQNKTLLQLDASNNELGEDFGKHLYQIIGFNKNLQNMDLRNTGLSLTMRNKFREFFKEKSLENK